jgi:predicted SnoaL-like aldol condensation-catalyzing enzyme
MKLSKAKLLSGALALLAIGCVPMTAQTSAAQEKKNQKMVMDWYREVVVSGHVDLVPKYMADSYVEHDPNFNGGRAEFVAHYEKMGAKPIPKTLPMAPAQAIAKGDYVVLVFAHPDKDPKTSTAYEYFTYDVVKVKDGKIQEHWDNARKAQ